MTATVEERVIRILAEKAVLRVEDVVLDQPLSELHLDSLGLVEALFLLEEAFDVSIPFNANDGEFGGYAVTTVRDVVTMVETLRQKAARPHG